MAERVAKCFRPKFYLFVLTDTVPLVTLGRVAITSVQSLSLVWLCNHIEMYLSVNQICTSCVQRHFSCVWLFATLWTVALQAPLSKGFFRQEYWSGLPFPFPEYLPNPGIKPGSPPLQAVSLPSEPLGKPPTIKYKEMLCRRRWCQNIPGIATC